MNEFAQSKRLHQAASEVLATGVSSGMRRHVTPVPLYFERGEGPYFFDVDGNQLLDYTLGWGPLIVGNNHPLVNAAVTQQLERAYAFGAQHELEITVARQIVAMAPGVEQVIFSNSGTEAVQAAMRIARAATGRKKIVKFEGHYHGWMNNILVSYHPAGGSPRETQPTCGGQPAEEYADTLVLPWNDPTTLRELLARGADDIAAVITEPLLANSGSCEPAVGYLQEIVDACRQHGVVSIFDEVITGFRLAPGGAREYYGVIPDLSVYGKALAGGFPVSAVGGAARMFDVLRDGRTLHAGTYNGGPIGLAAASATLDVLAQPGTFANMRTHGGQLQQAIRHAAATANVPLVISGAETVFSMHWGLEHPPTDYRATQKVDQEAYTRFRMAMLSRGVYLLPDGRWYLGAAHDDQALAWARDAIDHSMTEADAV